MRIVIRFAVAVLFCPASVGIQEFFGVEEVANVVELDAELTDILSLFACLVFYTPTSANHQNLTQQPISSSPKP